MRIRIGVRPLPTVRLSIAGIVAGVFGALALAASPAHAITVTLPTVSEGTIVDDGSNGSFETVEDGSGGGLSIRQFENLVAERVGLEYNVSSIPNDAVVTGARFTFSTVSFTSNTGRVVDVLGFAGNGSVTIADATAPAVPLGSYNSFTGGLGAQTVNLNIASLQALLAGDFVGLRLQAGAETVNTQIGSSAFGGSIEPPRLVIDYTVVPEPTSAALLFGGAWLIVGRRCRRISAH